MNATHFTSKSIGAVLDAILEYAGWEKFEKIRFVFKHPPKGKRPKRVRANIEYTDGVHRVTVVMPKSCTGERLGRDLHWRISKEVFRDDPGHYLHSFPCPELELKTKLEQGKEPPRDRMQEGRDKAAKHVARIEKELIQLHRDKARKMNLLRKWTAKVKEYDRRLRYRPQALAKAAKKRKEEKAWKTRVKEKVKALENEG